MLVSRWMLVYFSWSSEKNINWAPGFALPGKTKPIMLQHRWRCTAIREQDGACRNQRRAAVTVELWAGCCLPPIRADSFLAVLTCRRSTQVFTNSDQRQFLLAEQRDFTWKHHRNRSGEVRAPQCPDVPVLLRSRCWMSTCSLSNWTPASWCFPSTCNRTHLFHLSINQTDQLLSVLITVCT